jgi:hypothetical protein
MSDQITDPGERTRRELQAREDSRDAEKSRYETMRMLIELGYEFKAIDAKLTNHISDDKVVQDNMRLSIDSISSKVGSVSSAVNTEQLNNRYTLRELVVGSIAFCGAIGAFITFIVWVLGHAATGGKP